MPGRLVSYEMYSTVRFVPSCPDADKVDLLDARNNKPPKKPRYSEDVK